MNTQKWNDYGCQILSPFEKWMAESNLRYIEAEGLDAVIERLRAQGYNRVAEEVINLTRVAIMRQNTIETEDELRETFWQEFPQLDREKIRDYSGNGLMYRTDTRCTWVDWIDMLSKDGMISSELAHSATLDD